MQLTPAKICNLLGNFLVLVSLSFIVSIFWKKRDEISGLDFSIDLVVVLIITACLYGLAGFLLSGAWCLLVNRLGSIRLPTGWCHGVYGRTQINKYIPGNIFHFAGRHVLAIKSGLPHLILLGSTVYETLLLLAASSILAFTGLLLMRVQVQGASLLFLGSILTLIIVTVIITFPLAPYVARRRNVDLGLQGLKAHMLALWPCFLLYLSFFLITGTILFAQVAAFSDVAVTLQVFGNVIIIYACSWIAGYVTPGAPGGVGVREAIIIFSLSSMIGEAESTVVALLFRLTTVVGDIIFYFLSLKFSITDLNHPTDQTRL